MFFLFDFFVDDFFSSSSIFYGHVPWGVFQVPPRKIPGLHDTLVLKFIPDTQSQLKNSIASWYVSWFIPYSEKRGSRLKMWG